MDYVFSSVGWFDTFLKGDLDVSLRADLSSSLALDVFFLNWMGVYGFFSFGVQVDLMGDLDFSFLSFVASLSFLFLRSMLLSALFSLSSRTEIWTVDRGRWVVF